MEGLSWFPFAEGFSRKFCKIFSSVNKLSPHRLSSSFEANPYGSWVNSCPNARLGCKVDQPGISTTIWYINNEAKALVESACSAVQGLVVTK